MPIAILFYFLCAQHVSDINISITRSLRLFCWITTLVVLFLVGCVLEFRCGWVGVVSMLQALMSLAIYFTSYVLNMFRTLIYTSSGACNYSVELPHWSYCSWFDVCWSFGVVGLEWYPCCSCASACNTDTTPTQPYRNSNTHRTKNNTTNVVVQQNSCKLLMMYILMSETCWAHKKWNKIASDIKLVFYPANIPILVISGQETEIYVNTSISRSKQTEGKHFPKEMHTKCWYNYYVLLTFPDT